MTKPITIPNTFTSVTTATGAQLDADFSACSAAINDPSTYNNYLVDSGAANAYVVTFPAGSVPSSYTNGLTIEFVAANNNNGASTINVNGLGLKNIVRQDGSPVQPGDILTTGISKIQYNGTSFILQTPLVPVGAFSHRNRIINGSMSIDQRNNGSVQTFTAAAALAYCVDRWYGYCTGANVTGQRVAGSGASQYRYQFTGAASVTGIGFGQRIEAANCLDLNNTTVTLSAELANSLLTTVTWTAYYANTTDVFGTLASPTKTQIATGTFTVTSTVTRYSTQISIPSAATTGIEIVFSVGAQTSGTWTIGRCQLEAGGVATPFEVRPVGVELALCQRYLPGVRCTGSAASESIGTGYRSSTTGGYFQMPFPVPARVKPTGIAAVTPSNYSISDANATLACSALSFGSISSVNSGWLLFTTGASTAGYAVGGIFNASATVADAILFTGCEL